MTRRISTRIAAISAVLMLGVSGCLTPTESVVVPDANLARYTHATLPPVAGAAGLARMEAKVHNALASRGYKMIGEREAAQAPREQQERTLLVRLSVSQSTEESVVSVNLYDFITDKLLANCTGAFGIGFSMEHDLRVAADRAYTELEKVLATAKQ